MSARTSSAPPPAATFMDRTLAEFAGLYRAIGLLGYSLALAVLCVIVAAVAFPRVSGDFALLMAVLIGLALAIIILALLPSLLLPLHQYRVVRAEIASGPVWARWQYSDDDRQRIASAKISDSVRMIPLLNLIAMPFVFGWLGYMLASGGALLAGVFLVVGLLTIVLIVAVPPSLRQRRRKALFAGGLREVAIVPAGFWADGLVTPLYPAVGRVERAVELQSGEPTLLLLTSTYVSYDAYLGYTPTEVGQTIYIPVPHSHEAEAAALVERFLAAR